MRPVNLQWNSTSKMSVTLCTVQIHTIPHNRMIILCWRFLFQTAIFLTIFAVLWQNYPWKQMTISVSINNLQIESHFGCWFQFLVWNSIIWNVCMMLLHCRWYPPPSQPFTIHKTIPYKNLIVMIIVTYEINFRFWHCLKSEFSAVSSMCNNWKCCGTSTNM